MKPTDGCPTFVRAAAGWRHRRTTAMDNRQELNRNLAQMLKGGVIMDVTTPEQV